MDDEGHVHSDRRSPLLDRMWDRIENTRSEGDTALFYDLMIFGELVTKLVVLALLSAVKETRERHGYRLQHRLVHANGIGEWVTVLEELLTGPASAHLSSDAVSASRELNKNFAPAEGSWQRTAIDQFRRACAVVDPTKVEGQGRTALKTWFTDFAWLRNRSRGHGAVLPTTCHQIVPELEESIRIITRNSEIFRNGWVYLRRNLNGKYRVTPMAGDTKSFDGLKSETGTAMREGVYTAFGVSQFRVSLIDSNPDLTDVFVANGNFKDSVGRPAQFELLSYYTDSVKFGEGSEWLDPPHALPPSETKPRPALDLIGGSFSNLPSTIPEYVSRPDLEQEVLALLRNNRHPIVTLVGRGGIGKTSLALTVLHELAHAGDFFAILWFSARDIDLLESGPKQVTPDVVTKEEIALTFSRLMSLGDEQLSSTDAVRELTDALTGEQAGEGSLLFVFDNFETVRNPAELYAFLDTYIRLPNKILITSRFRDFKGDYPVQVSGMSRTEFDALVDGTGRSLGILHLLDRSYRENLFDESDGHPYVAKVLLGEVARTGRAGSVERIMAGKDDILNALFERTFSSIPPAAQRTFMTLCNWRSVVPRLALEGALLRPANERFDVAAALEVLEQSSLVEMIRTEEDEGEFVRVPLAAFAFGQKKLRVSPMKAAIDADTELLRLFGSSHRSEIGKGLEPRIRRMIKSLAEKRSAGDDVDEEIALIRYVALRYPRAWLQLAEFHIEEREFAQAQECLTSYLAVEPADRMAWQRLAELFARLHDGQGEVFAKVEIARLPGASLNDISDAATTLNRHVANNAPGLGPDERRSMAAELAASLTRREAECDAYDFSRLAWLYLHLGRQDEARKCVVKGLRRDPSNHHCLNLAERLHVGLDGLDEG